MTILCDHEIEDLCSFRTMEMTLSDGRVVVSITKDKSNTQRDKEDYIFETNIPSNSLKVVDLIIRDTVIDDFAKANNDERPMIFPFVNHSVNRNENNEKILSYGLSSFGYDFRIAPEFKIFTNINNTIVDPKAFDEKAFVHYEGDVCIIPPNSFVLARTVEMFHMPDDVVGICVGKSTIARVGINCLVTPVEPGWNGYLTLEFANTTPLPAKLYANEGGLQIQFYRGKRPRVTYSDRGGKYQGQKPEVTLPKT